MLIQTLLTMLQHWNARPDAATFPLDAVIAEFRRVGKHFVAPALLTQLAAARAALPAGAQALRRFLDTTLDKHDKHYDNPTYLALHDLPLPSTAGGCPLHTAGAQAQRDRLLMLLVADVLRFELAALDGATDLMPLLRPATRTVGKRCALALRVLRTVMPRLGLDAATASDDPVTAAEELIARIAPSAEEGRMLAVTMLPVSRVHDEYMFIRLLQCWETVFTQVAVELRAAMVAVRAGMAARASQALRAAAAAMNEAAPLFSMVASKQPQAFLTLREYTEGASAIPARGYKSSESRCR
jgi:hypothetical protein